MRYYGGLGMSEELMENGELRVENGGSAWRECELKEVAEVQTGPNTAYLRGDYSYISDG